jgi:hypothetical protein
MSAGHLHHEGAFDLALRLQGCDPPSSAMMSACLLPAAQLEDEQIGAKEIMALIRLAM